MENEIGVANNFLMRVIDEYVDRIDFPWQVSLCRITKLCVDIVGSIELFTVSDYESLVKILNYIIDPSLVKEFPEKEDRDYDASDFQNIFECAVNSFICLKHMLPKLHFKLKEQKLLQSILIPVLKICATHSQIFLWSSSDAVCISREVLEEVLRITESHSVTTLLCQSNGGSSHTLFKSFLMSIRPMLTKETWTRNPSTCQIFKWLLFHVKHPYLNDYLTDVLPPSLIFIDHHATRNKVLGIECLDHIVENVPPTELKMYGRADVVYDALFNLLYLREVDIIQVLYPCILKFLGGQERSRDNVREPRKWGRYDDVYHQLMWNMEIEDNIAARREFSSHVCNFIEKLGITIARHLKRTKRVILNYLSIFEGPEEISRINVLKALEMLIKVAWPRMEYHCEDFIHGILFLVYDIETDRATTVKEVKKELLDHCRQCLLLLKVTCPEKVKELVSSLGEIEEDVPGLNFFLSICK